MRPTDPRLRRQLAPARRPLAVTVAAGLAGSLLLIAQAYAVTELLLAALGGSGRGAVGAWALVVVAVFAGRGIAGWVGDVAAARAAGLVGADLRRRVVGALLRGRGASGPSGSLSVLATRGVTAAEPYLTRYVPALVLAGVLPFLVLVAIAVLDPMSGLIVLATLPLIPVFGILVGLATRDRAESQWRAMSTLSGHFLDVVRGLPTLVAFRRAEAQSATIRAVTERYRVRTLQTLRIAFASSAILELVATISVALVAVTVGIRLADGHLSLEKALIVLLLAPEAYWPLRRVGTEFHAAAEGVATFEAAADLEIPSSRESWPVESGVVTPLVVSDLSVTYAGRTWPALAPVSAEIPARGVTAITGPSGCGKSTLLAAVAGLVEPTEGSVRIGARKAADDAAWQSAFAWVPQRPVFVRGTVADNLRLAAPDATDERLWAALGEVALARRVSELPAGLDTDLAEDGASLSAGERARLALARAVLADRPWVLLDEPTAHLDAVTEQVIADTVVALGRSRGVVLVAHKQALVALADRVLGLEPPEVVDEPQPPTRRATTPDSTSHKPRLDEPQAPTRRGRLWWAAVLGGLATASGVALTALAGWLIVKASYHPVILTLLVAMVGVRTFGLARPGLRYVERLRSHDAALRLLAEARVKVYDALVPLVPGALPRRRGDLLASVVDDVDCVLDEELRVRLPVRSFAIAAAMATVVAALLAPVAGAVVGGCCVVGGAAAFVLARRGATRAEGTLVATRAEISDAVVEAAQAATELRMWQADTGVLVRMDQLSLRSAAAATTAARWLGAARAVVLLTAGLGVAAVVWLLRDDVAAGTLSGPLLALLALLPLALAEGAATVADAGGTRARTVAAAGRLADLTGREPAVREPHAAGPAPVDTTVAATALSADRGGREVLDGLDLTLVRGERVAVVGASGSGKSTLAALLLRFLDPARGAVTLGGRPLDELALADVRRRVGLVDDDPHVFASTLVENVRLARPEATDPEVEAVLRRAHLGDWLDALPDGLHTRLGDGAAGVSGGERARLAVARSLLADQPVLVLDEPVAHLDTSTAEQVAREVLTGEDGRSIVWMSHAETGLELADRVVSLDRRGVSQ
ncbi:thiol reductant ABC exporter subunit CydD [Nocardioides sp. KR10-350]|uniref:thiol reductant ABC exporter subunit CydD n=1 Tax=Nocardioides cheoyonin TaxID=3156615 RepID=UPI0032B582E0